MRLAPVREEQGLQGCRVAGLQERKGEVEQIKRHATKVIEAVGEGPGITLRLNGQVYRSSGVGWGGRGAPNATGQEPFRESDLRMQRAQGALSYDRHHSNSAHMALNVRSEQLAGAM